MKLLLTTTLAWMLLLASALGAEKDSKDSKKDSLDDPANIAATMDAVNAVDDPIFDRYVDLNRLDAAWTFLDAAALADIGIGLAEAERILFRTHPAITSQEVLKVAVRTAGVTKKPETLKRLRSYAEEHRQQELLEQIDLASQLAGASRSIAPQLSLDDVSLGAFIAYKQAQHDLNTALVFGSINQMKSLQAQVDKWSKKDPAIWDDLKEHINEQVGAMESLGAPSRGGPEDMTEATEALNMLTAESRGWPPQFGPGGPGFGGPGGPGFGGPGFGGGPAFGGGFGQGGQFQNSTTVNGWQQTAINVQRPGALVGGAAMSGIANGLNRQNPQKNAVAVGILDALGQAMMLSSNPSITQQGGISVNQQGGFSKYGYGN